MIAKTFMGLEEILAEELRTLGAKDVEIIKRAVRFKGDLKLLYRANYEARTALRVLVPFYNFKAKTEKELYDGFYKFNWQDYFSLKDTFCIDSVVFSDFFKHSKFAALKAKDGLVDQFRDKTNRRPSVDTSNPTVRINMYISNDVVSLSLDSSGIPLFKRGYRMQTVEAPINEVLAAGMILMTGWRGERDFLDPMCGSGTLPIEATMIARNIPAQINRDHFGFEQWANFDESLWKEVINEARDNIRPLSCKVFASDISMKSVRLTEYNVEEANLVDDIKPQKMAFNKLENPGEGCLIITNPPYNERLKDADINAFYKEMGDLLKQNFQGSDAWLISSNKHAMKNFGLRTSKRIHLLNGPIPCTYYHFELYRGTRKKQD